MPIDPRKIKKKMVYSVAETADFLQKSHQSVRLYIKDGILVAKKGPDKRLRIEGQELIRFINGESAN